MLSSNSSSSDAAGAGNDTDEARNSAHPMDSASHRSPPTPPSFSAHPGSEKLDGVTFPLTRETRATHAYKHGPDAVVEYPHTEPAGPRGGSGGVAHIFPVRIYTDESGDICYDSPLANLAYSRSNPSRSGHDRHRTCLLFSSVLGYDRDDLKEVDFIRSEYTCSGGKLCKHAPASLRTAEHRYCTPELLKERVREQRHESHDVEETAVPELMRILIDKTLALKKSLAEVGCGCKLSAEEVESLELRTGTVRCPGRLEFGYDKEDRPFVKCEFRMRSRPNHRFEQHRVMDTHVEYLEALFSNNSTRIDELEVLLRDQGLGPLPACTFVAGSNAQRTECPFLHRLEDASPDAEPARGKLFKQKCKARFILFSPPEEHIVRYPYVVLFCTGVHSHPLPLPTRTPAKTARQLGQLLDAMSYNIADVTPRRLMRHPAVGKLLQEFLPLVVNPTLADLHPSLANNDHVAALIRPVKKKHFPRGTGWAGIQYQLEFELALPLDEQYMRRVVEFPFDSGKAGRYVLCMSKAQSARCLNAVWRVCDISFKRAPPWYEFELGTWDHKNKRTDVFCRAFCNSKSARMHFEILRAIEEIVLQDTGSCVRWCHIHSQSLDQPVGTMGYSADLDTAQVQGHGLLFQHISHAFPEKRDLHDSSKLLSSLTWQDHAYCSYRACEFHVFETIKGNGADEAEKALMRFMVDGTKARIDKSISALQVGSQPARNWTKHKVDSGFILQGLCFEMNYIPLDVWRISERTSGVSESSHADINLEGKNLSLLSAIEHGRRYDLNRTHSLQILANYGITRSWIEMDAENRILRSIKRTDKKKADARAVQQDKRSQLCTKITAVDARRQRAATNIANANAVGLRDKYQGTIDRAEAELVRLRAALAILDARLSGHPETGSSVVVPTTVINNALPSAIPATTGIAEFGLPDDMPFIFDVAGFDSWCTATWDAAPMDPMLEDEPTEAMLEDEPAEAMPGDAPVDATPGDAPADATPGDEPVNHPDSFSCTSFPNLPPTSDFPSHMNNVYNAHSFAIASTSSLHPHLESTLTQGPGTFSPSSSLHDQPLRFLDTSSFDGFAAADRQQVTSATYIPANTNHHYHQVAMDGYSDLMDFVDFPYYHNY